MATERGAFTIQQATRSDVWAVRQLFKALHDFNAELDERFALSEDWEHYLDEHLSREWRGVGRSMTFLAWRGDDPIGLLMMGGYTDAPLFRYRHWAEILALYVDPNIRGGEVARKLVEVGKLWALDHGYDRIQLYVTATNERAKGFYSKGGFFPVQEVWRLDLEAADREHIDSPSIDYEVDRDPLHGKPHQIVTEFDKEDSD